MSDCEECNEIEYIFEDLKQKIKLLEGLAPTLGEEEVAGRSSNATTLAAELEALHLSIHRYRAHLIRTKAQAFVKYDYMQYLGQDDSISYALSDYWAKLQPTKAMQATCEGTQAGISCHGTTFYYKNPSFQKRQEYTHKFNLAPDFFEGFPEPEEQSFVCENFQVRGLSIVGGAVLRCCVN